MFVNFQNQTYPSGGATTMMAGGAEEGGGGMTTQAFGEEGGGYFPPGGGGVTTMAARADGGSEEGGGGFPPPGNMTTMMVGEEGGGGYPTPYGADEKTTLGNLARNFSSLDQNHDGFLQAPELAQAGNNPATQAILNSAYELSFGFAESNNGSSMQGLSQGDLIVAATRAGDGISLNQQVAEARQRMGQTGNYPGSGYPPAQATPQNPMQGMMQMMMQMLQMMMGIMGGQAPEPPPPPPPPPPPANDFGGMMDPETMMLFMQVLTKLLELTDAPAAAEAK